MIETVVYCDWCGQKMQSVRLPGALGTLQDTATTIRVGVITYSFDHTCSDCKKTICEVIDDLKFQLANGVKVGRIPRKDLEAEIARRRSNT